MKQWAEITIVKVNDLLENDWDNNPETLQFLRKKMLASCHRFVLQATKVGFYDPNKNFYFNLLSSQSSTSGMMRGLDGAVLGYANQNLKLRFDEMKIAKQEYEQAGGRYEG